MDSKQKFNDDTGNIIETAIDIEEFIENLTKIAKQLYESSDLFLNNSVRKIFNDSANLNKSEKNTTVEERNKSIREAFAACSTNPPVRISDIAKYLRVSERTVRNRINDMGSEFTFNNGIVTKIA